MDPKHLPPAILLALGLAGCGDKDSDDTDTGPCLSQQLDTDTGDTSPCLEPGDSGDEAVEMGAAPARVQGVQAQEQRGVLQSVLEREVLPSDVASLLTQTPEA